MREVSQVFQYRVPSGLVQWIASWELDLDDVAARFGATPQTWTEDGLGSLRGLIFRLPSGRTILIRELVHLTKQRGSSVLDVCVDGGDIVALGADFIVDEIAVALSLPSGALVWKAPESIRQHVADQLERWRAYKNSLRSDGAKDI
jgi:hypothetical protein